VTLTYGQLRRLHPEYDADEWRRCEALYAGGRKLLGDPVVMADLFPRHAGEELHVYEERKKRAFIVPYAGQIVDGIVSAVFSDSFTVELDGKPLPEESFWHEFGEDCSPPGGVAMGLRQLARELFRVSLIKRRAWALVELPPPPETPPANLLEEEQAGQRDAYVCILDPECVTNWKVERNGELRWAITRYLDESQHELDDPPGLVRAEYTLYTPSAWTRWTFQYLKEKPPKDDAPMTSEGIEGLVVTSGPLSFGRVPLVRLELPDGLYAMGKLASMATEHFNKDCARAWGEYRGLFQFLAFFLQDTFAGGAAEDPNRAVNQTIGPGRAWTGAEKDRVEVISANPAPFEAAMKSLDRLRDEMFRVVHQMSQAVNMNSSAALMRSGVSKGEDKKGEALVYLAFGEMVIALINGVLAMAARGRGEVVELRAKGMDTYDDVSLEALVNQEVALETVPIPSTTFQVERKFELARRYLGERANDEILEKIREELEAALAQETLVREATQDATIDALENPPENDDENEPRGRPVAPPSKGVAFSSKPPKA
jgi:hypothetical protein